MRVRLRCRTEKLLPSDHAKCSPVPDVARLARLRDALAVIAVSCAVLLVLLGNPPWRNNFISPGEVSRAHSGEAFAALAVTNHLNQSCGACHVWLEIPGRIPLFMLALHAEPGIRWPEKETCGRKANGADGRLMQSCVKCHIGKKFSPAGCGGDFVFVLPRGTSG